MLTSVMMKTRLLFLNGSLRGTAGNTQRFLMRAATHLNGRAQVEHLSLADYTGTVEELVEILRQADGFLLGSGVYWNSHGSPMQRFLEVVTGWEATDVFLGKPVGVVLGMDSVGGMEVASRLLSVLNLFGCTSPPFAAVVLSRVSQKATADSNAKDVYAESDVCILADNILLAAQSYQPKWLAWEVSHARRPTGAYPSHGTLNVDIAQWASSADNGE